MTSRRNWGLVAVVGLAVVGAIVTDRLSGESGDDRLLSSAPSTAPPISFGRSATTTTAAAGSVTGPAAGAGAPASVTSVPGGAAAVTITTTATTTGPASPGVTAAGERRISGISGGADSDASPVTDRPVSGRGGGSGATPGPTSTTAPATSSPVNLNLSRDDNTKTFTLKRNDSITLRLEPVSGTPWTEPVSSGAAVTRDFTSNLDGVLVTTFTATAAGTATITSTASPTAFSVTITVTP